MTALASLGCTAGDGTVACPLPRHVLTGCAVNGATLAGDTDPVLGISEVLLLLGWIRPGNKSEPLLEGAVYEAALLLFAAISRSACAALGGCEVRGDRSDCRLPSLAN